MNIRIFGAMALVLAAASLVLAAGSAADQTGGVRDANFGGVSFRYDTSLADGAEGKLVPETPASPDLPYWMAAPRHLEFSFVNYRGTGTQSPGPAMYIYPVRGDYSSFRSGSNRDLWLPTVRALQKVVSDQPDPHAWVAQLSSAGAAPNVAVLPPVNAAAIVTGKPGYVSFSNGLGLRYLVQLTQSAAPPDPDTTFYTFQGLTGDAKYYVAAFFPAFPSAVEPIQPPQGSDVRSYYLNLIDRFDSIANDAYTPNLDSLDKMIGSLNVHPTGITEVPGMPSTGTDVQWSATSGLILLAGLMIIAGGLVSLRRSN